MEVNLQKLLNQCQTSLLDAAQNPENDWKLFTIANVSLEGQPKTRYVVLRDASFESKAEVVFFTDKRSTKITEFQNSPHASLCFFDRSTGLQAVMKSTVSLHNQDDISKEYWEKTSWRSLQCYYMKEKPGETLTAPFVLNAKELTEEQAYSYFTVVKCSIHSWDLLLLTKTGNERAFCEFSDSGSIENATWIAP